MGRSRSGELGIHSEKLPGLGTQTGIGKSERLRPLREKDPEERKESTGPKIQKSCDPSDSERKNAIKRNRKEGGEGLRRSASRRRKTNTESETLAQSGRNNSKAH